MSEYPLSTLSRSLRGVFLAAFVLAGVSLLPSPRAEAGPPASYGEIEIAADIEPNTNPTHGYVEYRFQIKNRSSDRTVRVGLQMPGEYGGRSSSGSLTSVTKTVEVAPGGISAVSIFQPSAPDLGGAGVAVYINGRKQEALLAIGLVSGASHPSGYSRRRGRTAYYSHKTSSGIQDSQILASLRVNPEFFKTSAVRVWGGGGVPFDPRRPGEAKGGPPIAPGGFGPREGFQVTRSDLPTTVWSGHWLAYSRYDGIVVTTEDMEDLQRAGAEARVTLQSIWQYVESGGVLLVLGDGKKAPVVPLPAAAVKLGGNLEGMAAYAVGFGRCLVAANRDPNSWTEPRWGLLKQIVNQTGSYWRGSRSITDLNTDYPVVDDLGVPVRGLFGLMVLFAITIGPANLIILSRLQRRIWLLWTVPALSLVFCLAVLSYMIVAEGWQGHARIGGITFLDEVEKRSATLARAGFYSPLTPGDGLHFSDTTEVQILGDEHSAWNNSCTVDWTNDQHLARGWVSARIPAYFTIRKSEALSRLRLTVRREGESGLGVVNTLGADIVKLALADDKGIVYRASDPIAVGANAALIRRGPLARNQPAKLAGGEGDDPGPEQQMGIQGLGNPGAPPGDAWRHVFSAGDWIRSIQAMEKDPESFLRPGMYLAVVETNPFLEPGLKGARQRPTPSIILGYMADFHGKR